MLKLAELMNLEKESNINLAYVDYVADEDNEAENIRTRLAKSRENGKYYFHQMQNGNVIKCFEIALSWVPFGEFYVFNYTPDDLHIYEIDSRQPAKIEIKNLDENLINVGMKCEYEGMTVEYESENSLKINGKSIQVVSDSEYVFKLLKRKIRARDGAKGLYRFLENIAANGNFAGYDEDVKIGNFKLMSFDRSYWMRFKAMYVKEENL